MADAQVAVEPDEDPDESHGDGRKVVAVETRRRLNAEPVMTSTAHAGVTGPDDAPVIVIEHGQSGGSYSFVMDDVQARALRDQIVRALNEYYRIRDENQ